MSQPRHQKYPPEALALFAEYRHHRELYRPPECDNGQRCWSRDGPPAVNTRGRCAGCGGNPKRHPHRRNADGPL